MSINKVVSKIAALFFIATIFGGAYLISNPVYQIWQANNKILVSSPMGLQEVDDYNNFKNLISDKTDRITALYSTEKALCAGTYNGILHILSDSASLKIELPVQKNGLPYLVNGITFSNQHWWVSALEGVVFKVNQKGNYLEIPFIDLKTGRPRNILSIAKDNNKHLWISTINGIYFLTDIHKSRQKKSDFLASSAYNFQIDRILESSLGAFVFGKIGNKQTLYLGTLSSTLMDGIKKEINLPSEFSTTNIKGACFINESLWLLSGKYLYELKNYNWIKHEVEPYMANSINGISIKDKYIYIASNEGLIQVQYF